MAIDRRKLLQLPAAALAGLAIAPAIAEEQPLFLTALAKEDGGFGVAAISAEGEALFGFDLDGRGHDAAVDARDGRAVMFARRPGTFAAVVDLRSRQMTQVFATPANRHFFGHGIFSADGRLLYATENDFEAGRGVLGIYDAGDGFRRIGEMATGGVGPHEIVMAPGGRHAIVANGGIDTDPRSGRDILNPDGMEPSLARIDLATGDILDLARLEDGLRQLSIRHLAVDSVGACWFGCQWEGDRLETPPLVGRWTGNGRIDLFAAPKEMRHLTRNYVGAMAANGSGLVAASCPKGGMVMLWDAASGAFLHKADLPDGCGIAGDGEGILATSGEGTIVRLDRMADRKLAQAKVRFDNHLRRFSLGT